MRLWTARTIISVFVYAAFFPIIAVEYKQQSIEPGKNEYESDRPKRPEGAGQDRSDPIRMMTAARSIIDGNRARGMYKKIVVSKTAPDSIRAEAFYRLACISYMAANYSKARDYCREACSLDVRDQYTRLQQRTETLVNRDSLASGKEAAEKTDSMQEISGKIKPVGRLSESAGGSAGATAFYLQVAAFTEMENARGLQKDLARTYSNVTIKEGANAGKNVYRVRIGAFSCRKDAQTYGDSALVKNKLSFRIVEE